MNTYIHITYTYTYIHITYTYTYTFTHTYTHVQHSILKDTCSGMILVVESTVEQVMATVLSKHEIQKLSTKEWHLYKK